MGNTEKNQDVQDSHCNLLKILALKGILRVITFKDPSIPEVQDQLQGQGILSILMTASRAQKTHAGGAPDSACHISQMI